MSGSPLTAERVDALFAPLKGAKGLLLAISGGPDSTALLLLAAAAAGRGACPPIFAATVDHGLRPEGALEAEAVAALCRKLGAPHALLRWTGDKPDTRLQERARDARYALLAEEARRVGADTIVTAHHLDDQAETVLFRLMRGSGIGGLAGIAALSARDGMRLARPLLDLDKTRLIEICESAGVAYARDPSNENERFARVRLRGLMPRLAAEGLDAPALARLARRAAQVEAALEQVVDAAEARIGLNARAACDAAALFDEPLEIAQRLLARAITRVGGRDEGRIGLEKIEALAAALREAQGRGEPYRANVGGVLASLRGGRLRLEPEPPRL